MGIRDRREKERKKEKKAAPSYATPLPLDTLRPHMQLRAFLQDGDGMIDSQLPVAHGRTSPSHVLSAPSVQTFLHSYRQMSIVKGRTRKKSVDGLSRCKLSEEKADDLVPHPSSGSRELFRDFVNATRKRKPFTA